MLWYQVIYARTACTNEPSALYAPTVYFAGAIHYLGNASPQGGLYPGEWAVEPGPRRDEGR